MPDLTGKYIGQTLGKYQLDRYIDGGAFGEVYHARHLTLKTEAAVKVLYADRSMDEGARQRFILEAQSAAVLDHPNIVRILDMDQAGDLIYIAMEYLPGGNLKQWRSEKGAIAWQAGSDQARQALPILLQVAQALDYAHQYGLVHRDVKPTNILLAGDGSARLGDFGVARPADAPHLTQLGRTVGTPAYMSPEQAESRPKVDGRADQYSLGVIAYELLVGQLPFQGENSTAVALMQVTKPPPAPSGLNPAVSDETEEVLLRVLEKDPERRFPTCVDFISALEAALYASEVERFQAQLAEARRYIQDGQYREARQELEKARLMIADQPGMREALAELERQNRLAETSEQMTQEWATAQQKAQVVLEQYPAFPDPDGVFPALGLRPEKRRLAPGELARQVGVGLLAGALASGLFFLIAFLLIIRL